MIRKIVNFALFDACWTACVLAGARDLPAVALAASGAVVGVNLWWFSKDRASDLRLLPLVTLIGFVMDTANLRLGVFSLVGDPHFPHVCPLWLVVLWAAFGTTLRGSLSWLAGRYGLAALLGAVAGPWSYLGGAKLGAVTIHPNLAFSMGALAVGWAVVMPVLVWLAHGRKKRCASA